MQAEAGLNAARQDILLRAIVAYLNILRAQGVLKFAVRSEANIKRQTELENARVERGAGLSTDVLQAKQQLAGAQARRVRARGALAVARNSYKTVFGFNARRHLIVGSAGLAGKHGASGCGRGSRDRA